MKIVQFMHKDKQCLGLLEKDGVKDLSSNSDTIPNCMVKLLHNHEDFVRVVKENSKDCQVLQLNEVKLLSPITGCEKVVCVGLNYKDHCSEQNLALPEEPVIFSKFPSAIIASGDNIIIPKLSDEVDWEVELAVVIGKEGKHIKKEEAFKYVAGYTVANDVSARDWQMRKNAKQWLLGKTFDTFCPLGPALVTKDSVADPHNLDLKCVVNGKVVQSSNTRELVFNIPECIAWVSQFFKLKPGDVLLTGTPPGVGVFQKPPVFLKAGDVVSCEVAGIGSIENKVVSE